jgi:Na+/proline symporter
VINDLFRPFIKKDGSEKYYVKVSRITTFVLLLLAFIVTTQLTKISDAWKFILACSGGIGLVLILRWFWWRINAWSEIAAMLAPFAVYPLLTNQTVVTALFGIDEPLKYETILLIIVGWSSLVWIIVTFLTRPTKLDVLQSFYTRIHPGGRGWRKISKDLPEVKGDTGYKFLFVNWIAGSLMVLFVLFGIGKLIFAEYLTAILYIIIAITCAIIIIRNMRKIGWKKVIK